MAGPFKLRSGNSPLFKKMGSPYHQQESSKHDYSIDPWPKGSYVEKVSIHGGRYAPDATTWDKGGWAGLKKSTSGWYKMKGTNLWRKYKEGFGPSVKGSSKGPSMKDFAIGSKERHQEYERRGWAHDETSKVINK